MTTLESESKADQPVVFEQSLAQLQKIVSDLEGGGLGLEESLQRFEQGITLLRSCYSILERTEQRIEKLTGFDAAGQPQTAPFDSAGTVEEGEPAPRKSPSKRSAKAMFTDPE